MTFKRLVALFSLTIIVSILAVGIFSIAVPVEKLALDEKKNSKEYFFNSSFGTDQIAYHIRNIENRAASFLGYNSDTLFFALDFKKQEHALTCEVAALRMALNHLGVDVTETELIAQLSFSTTAPRSPQNVWGDPQKGFVGNIDGSIFLGTGYGVYNKPIRDLALKYRTAEIMEDGSLEKILEHAQNGRVVITWGLLSSKYATYWTTDEGNLIKAFPGEHARIVIGYSGNISNPTHVLLMDPLYGIVKMDTKRFITEWEMVDKMAVVIY